MDDEGRWRDVPDGYYHDFDRHPLTRAQFDLDAAREACEQATTAMWEAVHAEEVDPTPENTEMRLRAERTALSRPTPMVPWSRPGTGRLSAMADVDLFVAADAATFDHEGAQVVLHAGTVVLARDPVVRGRENLFEPLAIVVDHQPDLPLSLAQIRVVGTEEAGYRRSVRVTVQTGSADLTCA